jgi:sigma-B regulation protein RsbU (phosphoserine phosphatase)
MAEAAVQLRDAAPGATPLPQAGSPARPPLVLIVDDDELTGFVIQHTLRATGLETLAVRTVADALVAIAERRPDIVLLDIQLPDGDGFQVCRHMQRDPGASHTPVLFISGVLDVSMKIQAFEAGAVDYITKPLAPAEVNARVCTHLRLRQAYEQLAALQAERIERLALAQEALMPQPASVPGAVFHVARRQVLAAGGDFYDVIRIGEDVVDFIVADTSGHDLGASYWTAALKTLLTEYASPTNPPRLVLQQLNDALFRILPPEVYFTMQYARWNKRSRRVTLVNAGHPPAVVLQGHSSPPTVIDLESDVVGAFPDAVFATQRFEVSPGDRLLLFTDGLIETGGSRATGLGRLCASAAASRRLSVDRMVEQIVRDTLNGEVPTDDIVLLGAEL